ncbi:hypothetical protein PCL_05147 [Purpureocillium lilacinum]|uniref:Actin lateral binding protein n=3 Tax=Purpureocillium lilacinum TaxID=33203 RepID=A0A2U3DW20_PURLI|nr:hypothetical protein Purlil1_8801 [Purpureocillium lilacinum]PWI66449.1 hypothetical protein PCL_05147 [Purpureocillium lilacinum]
MTKGVSSCTRTSPVASVGPQPPLAQRGGVAGTQPPERPKTPKPQGPRRWSAAQPHLASHRWRGTSFPLPHQTVRSIYHLLFPGPIRHQLACIANTFTDLPQRPYPHASTLQTCKMDRIKEKMNSLRLENDEANAKIEELQAKNKVLEQEGLANEQEIKSLQHKNGILEGEVEKLEAQIKDFKKAADEGQQHGTQNETLQRRLQLLEDEAEEADKTLRETNEKLRQTDVKAGHFERKVQACEAERDQWEAKYEEMAKKYATLEKDLKDLQDEIGNI